MYPWSSSIFLSISESPRAATSLIPPLVTSHTQRLEKEFALGLLLTREARKAQLTLSRVGRTAAGPYLSDSLVILGAQTARAGVHS